MFLLGVNMESVKVEAKTAIWYMILAARTLYVQYWKVQKILETDE